MLEIVFSNILEGLLSVSFYSIKKDKYVAVSQTHRTFASFPVMNPLSAQYISSSLILEYCIVNLEL